MTTCAPVYGSPSPLCVCVCVCVQEILRRVKPGSLPASQVTYLITEATRAGHSRIATALLTWDAGHTEGLLLAALKSAIWAGQVTCSQDILADTTHTASVLGTQSQHGKLETMPDSDWEAALMQALHADKPECADVVLSAWREQHAALQRQPGCLARDMHQQAVAVTKALVRGLEGSVGLRYPQMARWFHGRLMDVSRPEWEKTVVEETLEAGARTILSKAVFMGQTEVSQKQTLCMLHWLVTYMGQTEVTEKHKVCACITVICTKACAQLR